MREGAHEIQGESFASPRQTLLAGCETQIDNPHAVAGYFFQQSGNHIKAGRTSTEKYD